MKIRVFISIPIPNTAGLGPLMDNLAGIRGVKVASVKQLHVTLRFLGDIEEEKVDDVERIVNESIAGVGRSLITLNGLGAFPNKRAPRILWAGITTQIPLEEIADRISRKLKAAGIPFDEKPFKPHITVAHVDGKPNLVHEFSMFKTTEFARYMPSSVNIMKSELKPSGAVHTILRVCYFR